MGTSSPFTQHPQQPYSTTKGELGSAHLCISTLTPLPLTVLQSWVFTTVPSILSLSTFWVPFHPQCTSKGQLQSLPRHPCDHGTPTSEPLSGSRCSSQEGLPVATTSFCLTSSPRSPPGLVLLSSTLQSCRQRTLAIFPLM